MTWFGATERARKANTLPRWLGKSGLSFRAQVGNVGGYMVYEEIKIIEIK